MPDLFQLFNSVSCLNVRVVSSSNSSHGGGFISGIRLSGVLKIRVRTTRAVDADVTSGGNVRAPVRFAHNRNNSYSTGSTDRFGFEEGGEFIFIVFGDGADNLDKFGGFRDFVFACGF